MDALNIMITAFRIGVEAHDIQARMLQAEMSAIFNPPRLGAVTVLTRAARQGHALEVAKAVVKRDTDNRATVEEWAA